MALFSKVSDNVQDWQESGLSQLAFARHHDIKLATTRYWIIKHRKVSFILLIHFADNSLINA